jgi:hypothetical protein
LPLFSQTKAKQPVKQQRSRDSKKLSGDGSVDDDRDDSGCDDDESSDVVHETPNQPNQATTSTSLSGNRTNACNTSASGSIVTAKNIPSNTIMNSSSTPSINNLVRVAPAAPVNASANAVSADNDAEPKKKKRRVLPKGRVRTL